jgi:two-component system, OmpR family, copper resistance phosphate regulon response regulator CusR
LYLFFALILFLIKGTLHNVHMEAKTILLAAGDKITGNRLRNILGEADYNVDLALDGKMGKQLFSIHNYDLVLIDHRLPDIDGVELCNYIKGQDREVPIMVLSWNGAESKLAMLETGADDYVEMTQDYRELLLRIKVLTRRFCQPHKQKNRIAAGDIVIDLDNNEVSKAGKSIFLSAKELLLLKYLVCNKNRIVSRSEIACIIYASKAAEKEYRVAAFINSLRSKIEDDDVEKSLFTVTGKGYFLEEKVYEVIGCYN